MEYNQTITAMNVSARREATLSLASKVTESYASVSEHIRELKRVADVLSDGKAQQTWTTFETRTGHTVEKCAIEWWCAGIRHVDVVWIKRGYRWM